MNQNWEIKSRSHSCSATGREFNEGEMYYTLLFREGGEFRREDLSEEAYASRNDNIRPFSFWRGKYEPPAPPKPEALAAQDAEGLLRDMIESNQAETKNARFILAAMLERKKTLRPMPSSEPGMLIYEHVQSGEVFLLEDPQLSLEQLPAVQREVSELLGAHALG
jgi:hypothetical protein